MMEMDKEIKALKEFDNSIKKLSLDELLSDNGVYIVIDPLEIEDAEEANTYEIK